VFLCSESQEELCYMMATKEAGLVMASLLHGQIVGDVVASWLVCSSLDRAVRVRALAGDIVLCSWARHYSQSSSLHLGV